MLSHEKNVTDLQIGGFPIRFFMKMLVIPFFFFLMNLQQSEA